MEYFRLMRETTTEKRFHVNFLQCALERWVAETVMLLLAAYSSALISRVFPFKCLLLSGNPASELLLDEVMLL